MAEELEIGITLPALGETETLEGVRDRRHRASGEPIPPSVGVDHPEAVISDLGHAPKTIRTHEQPPTTDIAGATVLLALRS